MTASPTTLRLPRRLLRNLLLGAGLWLAACNPVALLEPAPTASVPAPTLAPATSTLAAITPTLEPATPTLEPATPTLRPSTPTLEPATPTVEPATSTLEPATPTTEPSATGPVFAYSANPAFAGALTITVRFEQALATAPTIAIDRPGVDDDPPQPMTGAADEWRFDFVVEPAGGMGGLDEPLSVTVSGIVDQAGNPAPDLVDQSAYVYAPASSAVLDSLEAVEFHKRDEPVLRPGPPGAWDAGGVDLGDVIKVGDAYWMYYAGSGAGDESHGIGLAISADGLEWEKHPEPLITQGHSGEWDSGEVNHPSVVWDNGLFHLWYVGRPQGGDLYSFRFLHTTSADGVHWTPAEPVLAPGAAGEWDEERIGGLDVLKVGNSYYMYYTASSLTPEFKRQIGCAISPDGDRWLKCEDNPVLGPRSKTAFEGNEVEGPSLVSLYGWWLMGYTGYGGDQGAHFLIGLVRSRDGLTWRRVSNAPAVQWGEAGSFDEVGTRQPALLLEGNRLWLWYTGRSETNAAIGLATATLE